jgi:steroid delta-isomerase-like uncharacterized protein
MATASEVLDRFVELFNDNRLEEVEQDYAPGSFAEEIGTSRRLTPSESTGNARAWKQAFPDARGTITSKVVEGNHGAAEIVWRGTNTGSLMGQPPTGKSVNVRAAVFVETNGRQITRSAHYIDVAGMMAQLGLSPGAQPTG